MKCLKYNLKNKKKGVKTYICFIFKITVVPIKEEKQKVDA